MLTMKSRCFYVLNCCVFHCGIVVEIMPVNELSSNFALTVFVQQEHGARQRPRNFPEVLDRNYVVCSSDIIP